MVRLLYDGVMAKGMAATLEGRFPVEKGGIYEVSEAVANDLLKSGHWKKVGKEKKGKKEVEQEIGGDENAEFRL